MYIIFEVEEQENIRIIKIADPWGNGPNILERSNNKDAIVDLEFSVFLDNFDKLFIVKVINDNFCNI